MRNVANNRYASSQVTLRRVSPVRPYQRFTPGVVSLSGVNPDAVYKSFVSKDVFHSIDVHERNTNVALKEINATRLAPGQVPYGTTKCTYSMLDNTASINRSAARI